ncbi:Tetratricopeptide repeat-containing protein [Oryzisolibacter propanilivorax]|uniref:Tetratricopeptide repeat-containing protein n=1 Tax=Oryzisolibacter propanilivorax TaxID=1527607 RepID=A0A1G9SYG6_9BURK|nr:tetratricopeptide repeat protein [Oryzisolibacter propanilivorax]SDM40464.1 Tetratricopeptide repeat-containing protein [Oryzisolibacter propanilivorax]
MTSARRPALLSLVRPALAALLLAAAGTHAQQAAPTTYNDVQQLLSAGKHAQALTQLDARLEQNGRDPQLRFLRAVALTQLGRQDEAIAALVDLTETYPELPEPYNNLAVLYAARNELGKARDALEMAVRARPDYAVAHENLGDIYLRLALQSYQRAGQLAPAMAKSVAPRVDALRGLLDAQPAAAR